MFEKFGEFDSCEEINRAALRENLINMAALIEKELLRRGEKY